MAANLLPSRWWQLPIRGEGWRGEREGEAGDAKGWAQRRGWSDMLADKNVGTRRPHRRRTTFWRLPVVKTLLYRSNIWRTAQRKMGACE